MRLVGSRPRRKAGRATEKTMDLRWRGGTVVISRLIVPSITCPAAYVMASMCQFGRYTSPGDTCRVHLCQRLRSSARKGKLFRSCRREDRARFRRSGRSDTNVRLHPAAGCANPAIRPMGVTEYFTGASGSFRLETAMRIGRVRPLRITPQIRPIGGRRVDEAGSPPERTFRSLTRVAVAGSRQDSPPMRRDSNLCISEFEFTEPLNPGYRTRSCASRCGSWSGSAALILMHRFESCRPNRPVRV
jgi:hypothetical protein